MIEQQIACQLQVLYGLNAQPTVHLIREGQGQSRIFRVDTTTSPLILRLYGPQSTGDITWIITESSFLNHMHRAGIAVAAPIAQADGTWVADIDVEGRRWPACLFAFAEGSPQWPPTPAQSHRLGSTLAQLHAAARGFTAPSRVYDLSMLVDQPLKRMLPFIPDASDRDELMSLGESIKAALLAIPTTVATYGMLHGDVHQGNAHFSATDEVTLFDFSLCGLGWHVYDFTGFLWPMRDETIHKADVQAACEHFLAGYESIRPLHPAERAAIPACVKARDLWETGDWIANDPATEPAVFREWMQTLLARFRALPLG